MCVFIFRVGRKSLRFEGGRKTYFQGGDAVVSFGGDIIHVDTSCG